MIKTTTFRNKKKKDWFSHEIGLVSAHGDIFKDNPGTLPHLRWSSFQQLVTEESCKGVHLICGKVLRSIPDFYISHHYMWSILALNINMNKQIFFLMNIKPVIYYKVFDNFTSDLKFSITISITTTKITFLTRWWMDIWVE